MSTLRTTLIVVLFAVGCTPGDRPHSSLLVQHPMFLGIARIFRGMVDLAHSRHAAAHNDLDVARRHRSAARGRIALAAGAIETVTRSARFRPEA